MSTDWYGCCKKDLLYFWALKIKTVVMSKIEKNKNICAINSNLN